MRRAFLFGATSLAVAMTLFLVGGWAAAVICIGAAELLIRKWKFERTGVEEALWLGGLFSLVTAWKPSGLPEAFVFYALAAAVAGARLRQPWFGALSVVLLLTHARFALHVPADEIAIVAQTIAAGAALLRARTWTLRSTDRLFGAIALAAPLIAADAKWPPHLIGGVVVLGIALWLRDRMLLVAAGLSLAIAGFDGIDRIDAAAEVKLIGAGLALVAVSLVVSRALRGRTAGIVVTPAGDAKYERAATVATALFVPPQPAPAGGGATFQGGGGDSGGGGASDSF